MLISVVTPVLNGARTITRTLDALSVQKGNFEHIVMDGGSTDDTEAIVRRYEGKYPVQWHSQPDKSIYEGVWNGMQRTRGDIMAYINADDFYLPWTLAVVRQVFETRPDVQWITGIPSWYFEDTGLAVTASYAPVYSRSLIRRGWQAGGRLGTLQQESTFWRRSLWDRERPKVEAILKRYRYAGDFHLWRHFAGYARLHTVSSVLACFTLSSRQVSTKLQKQYQEECGLAGGSFEVPAVGKLFNRVMSSLRSRELIRPALVSRRGPVAEA